MIATDEIVLHGKEAAKFLGCTEAALALWRKEGRGPSFVRVGRLIRYLRSDLTDWLTSRKVTPERGGQAEV